jgi:hypothetical protein
MNGYLTLNWANIKSAFVYGVLTSLATFLLVISQGILEHGSIFNVDWTGLVDKGAIAVLGVFVTIVSILKNLLTDAQGKFLGMVTVIPDKAQ